MNGIKQIGFAHTIATTNANNAFSEVKFLLEIVFELQQ